MTSGDDAFAAVYGPEGPVQMHPLAKLHLDVVVPSYTEWVCNDCSGSKLRIYGPDDGSPIWAAAPYHDHETNTWGVKIIGS